MYGCPYLLQILLSYNALTIIPLSNSRFFFDIYHYQIFAHSTFDTVIENRHFNVLERLTVLS